MTDAWNEFMQTQRGRERVREMPDFSWSPGRRKGVPDAAEPYYGFTGRSRTWFHYRPLIIYVRDTKSRHKRRKGRATMDEWPLVSWRISICLDRRDTNINRFFGHVDVPLTKKPRRNHGKFKGKRTENKISERLRRNGTARYFSAPRAPRS